MTSKQSEELTTLLTKLYSIQEQVGAVEKTSDDDKKARALSASQSLSMGKTKKAQKKGSRFLELKSSIVSRLKTVHSMQEEQIHSRRANPKEAIVVQAEIRELIRQSADEWGEMNELYKREARKKKSKFTPEELEVQNTLVVQLSKEIEKVKDIQTQGYANKSGYDDSIQVNLGALAALDSMEMGGGELNAQCFVIHMRAVILFCVFNNSSQFTSHQ